MQSPRRITLKDIAAQTKYHVTTVSMALRRHPGIPAATRDKIMQAAQTLGYRPDPMMSALAAYRANARPRAYRATLGWIVRGPNARSWRSNDVAVGHFKGVKRRAEELGYGVEPFWFDSAGMSGERATRILQARGIRGLLLCTQPTPMEPLALAWDEFSVVTLAYSWQKPAFSRVTFNYYGATIAALRELAARGYERIGLYLVRDINEKVNRLWAAGYLVETFELPRSRKLPIFFEEHDVDPFPALKAWLMRYRPDAILAQNVIVGDYLTRLGYAFPRDIGLAHTRVENTGYTHAGIDQDSALLGEKAVDCLVGMLHRNEHGIPRVPQNIVIDGRWHEAPTIRASP